MYIHVYKQFEPSNGVIWHLEIKSTYSTIKCKTTCKYFLQISRVWADRIECSHYWGVSEDRPGGGGRPAMFYGGTQEGQTDTGNVHK